MGKFFSDQRIRPAGGRRSPRSSELRSDAAERIIQLMAGKPKRKRKSNKRLLAFVRMGGEEKIVFLKQKLYQLYDQKLQACENELDTSMVDYNIDKLERQIQEIFEEMYE